MKNVGYRQYDLKNTVDLDTVFLLMREEKQNHFLFFQIKDEKHCLVPWIDNVTSGKIYEKMQKVSDGWTRSCEMNPANLFAFVYVWSDELNKYVECGIYDQYIK